MPAVSCRARDGSRNVAIPVASRLRKRASQVFQNDIFLRVGAAPQAAPLSFATTTAGLPRCGGAALARSAGRHASRRGLPRNALGTSL